jgi:sulfopyruvate decarboxylase TPP-binding subunit
MGTLRSLSRAVRVICSSREAVFGVVEEELVEVAEAKEEQGVGVLAFGGQVLAHERSVGVGRRLWHGRVRIPRRESRV